LSTLSDSWGSFAPEIAKKYLKSYGHPSLSSKELLLEVLKAYTHGNLKPKLLDLGCGNGQLGEFFISSNFECEYTGVDFSEVLLSAARLALPNSRFIQSDINNLQEIGDEFDVAIYSHVFELLSSPEECLHAAKRLADIIVIRFYEPPDFEFDSVELRWMESGFGEQIPYLRRKISRDFYRLILAKVGCKLVEVYRDSTKDQVHVLHF
jgi:ubiquinone/menaquinone biosynthesis C-methylase UbiE